MHILCSAGALHLEYVWCSLLPYQYERNQGAVQSLFLHKYLEKPIKLSIPIYSRSGKKKCICNSSGALRGELPEEPFLKSESFERLIQSSTKYCMKWSAKR